MVLPLLWICRRSSLRTLLAPKGQQRRFAGEAWQTSSTSDDRISHPYGAVAKISSPRQPRAESPKVVVATSKRQRDRERGGEQERGGRGGREGGQRVEVDDVVR